MDRIIFSKGLEAQIPSIVPDVGKPGYVTDTRKLIIGDGSANPPQFISNKSTGLFSYASLDGLTMPGGLQFLSSRPGAIGPITPARMVQNTGLLAYKGVDLNGQDTWNDCILGSSDQTLTVTNGAGQISSNIDLKINQNSALWQSILAQIAAAAAANTGNNTTTPTPTPVSTDSRLIVVNGAQNTLPGFGQSKVTTFSTVNDKSTGAFTWNPATAQLVCNLSGVILLSVGLPVPSPIGINYGYLIGLYKLGQGQPSVVLCQVNSTIDYFGLIGNGVNMIRVNAGDTFECYETVNYQSSGTIQFTVDIRALYLGT